MTEDDWEAGGLTQVCCGVQTVDFLNSSLFTSSTLLFLCMPQAVREADNGKSCGGLPEWVCLKYRRG